MNSLLKEKIITKRLLLIPISMEYKNEMFCEFTKEITTFMYPKPAEKIKETKDFINDSIKGLKNGNNLQLVILDKLSKKFLGCAGLHNTNTKTPEFGIWLKKSAHGNGYGKEAILEIKDWADNNIDYKYLLYPVADKNKSSRSIPEAMGGKIIKKYEQVGLSGNKYHCLEYRIYPDKKNNYF